MRLAARVDSNHQAVAEEFRRLGCSVLSLAQVGRGCPDLLIGIGGLNLLAEVKTSVGKLTPDQENFFVSWNGWISIVRSVEDARNLVQRVTGKAAQ